MKSFMNFMINWIYSFINNNKVIYVDIDGTLLDGSLDTEFKNRCNNEEFNIVLKWYESLNECDLDINYVLIYELIGLKMHGYKLVLWTNRGDANKHMTKLNLGKYWYIFDRYEFHDGKKSSSHVYGIVYDNEDKYVKKGNESSVLIRF